MHAISIAPPQVHYYTEALPTQHGYCAGVSRRSVTSNCEWRTCPSSLRGCENGIQTCDPSDEKRRIYECLTTYYYWY